MIEYKILNSNDIDEINELDSIRVKAFKLDEQTDVHANEIKDGKHIAVEALLDNKVIGGAYVYISPNTRTLNIDRIFILDEYRHNNYASDLLNYILSNKKYFEDYYDIDVNSSLVEPSSDELIEFYKRNGYKGPNIIGSMKKELDNIKTK